MLKNMLLASASAFIVLGAAASLTNMKAVITSGNQAEAMLTRDATDMTSQLNEMRIEQARQAALLSIQETAMRQLQRDLDRATRSAASMAYSGAGLLPESEYDIGLDLPSAQRERQAVDYQMAWLQAMTLDTELTLARARYDELRASASDRLAAAQNEAAARITQLEKETGFEITRLKEEIDQRDSSIVGLMHRLVSAQTGNGAVQPPMQAKPAAQRQPTPPKPETQPAATDGRTSEAKPDAADPAASRAGIAAADPAPVAAPSATVADGVAAYQAGEYTKAFDIWRPLANAGDARAWFYLGALYYEGRGVARELRTSHLLLSKAANAGHARAAELRDRVASELNDDQLAKSTGTTAR